MLETVVTSIALVCYVYIIYVAFRHHRWLSRNKILMYSNSKINMYGVQKDMSFKKCSIDMTGKPNLNIECFIDKSNEKKQGEKDGTFTKERSI